MKPSPDDDKTPWGDASAQQLATADRLLRAAKTYDPPMRVSLADVQRAVRVQRRLSAGLPARLAVAGAFGLCALLVMGGVALSRGWLGWRPRAVAPTVISVPAGVTTRVERRGRFRMALRGPGAVELGGAGNEESLRLEEGNLELENQARAVTVQATGREVQVSPSSTVTIDLPKQGALQVDSVAGPEPRIDGAPAPARAPAATPAPIVVTPPAARPMPPATPPTLPKVAPRPSVSERPVRAGAATEVTQLRDALARLRTERDPAGALALLDDYDHRFPGGLLRDEAAATRIEALLAVGQSTEALDRLETAPAGLLDRWPRLRIARGELRANHGRCDDALTDFAALLSRPVGDEIERRAQRGRAACLRLQGRQGKVDSTL